MSNKGDWRLDMSTALDGWDEETVAVNAPQRRGNDTTEKVQELLEQAKKSAHPLRDPGLERKIGEAIEHVKTKIDPRTG
jgi:hypothetical protein